MTTLDALDDVELLDMLEDGDTATIAIMIIRPPLMTLLFLPLQLVIFVSLWFAGFDLIRFMLGASEHLLLCFMHLLFCVFAMLSRKLFCSNFPICFVCDSSRIRRNKIVNTLSDLIIRNYVIP